MSKYCFLCLSDEGVFLNITPFNYKSLCGEVESYLPVKIEENKRGKQTKVCYKCAYELKQCSDFVKRYKESHTNLEKKHSRRQCCNLCLEPAKKGYIFKVNKDDNPLNNLWSTVEKLFDGNLPKIQKSPLICLTCRYILDILFDLTCLCQEMSKLKDKINKDIDYSEIPKVNTAVIKRKTTTTSFMRLKTYVISDSESESNTTKDQSTAEMNKNSQSKLRSCDECKNSIQHGEDMYRFHRSGLTVCATCRGSMDLSRHNKRKNERSTTNTKLCTVFLKDVLTDKALKKQKAYKIEKDSYGNQVYIITESESEIEADDKVEVSEESTNIRGKSITRSKLRMKSDSSDSEPKRKTRVKVNKQNKPELSKLRELPLRSSARRNHHSDTDILPQKSQQDSQRRGVKRRNISMSAVSDVDVEKKPNRKKLSAILEHFIPLKDRDNISDDMSIIEENVKEKSTNGNERKRKTRSSSASSTNESEHSPTIKYTKRTKLSEKVSSPAMTDVDENNTETNNKYICSKCCAIHENKLVAATHELSHCKQLELKLHKINISDKLEDEQQTNEWSERQLNDELADQQNEEITLTVNDDEDVEVVDVTDDTKKQIDKETCLSLPENQEENSVRTDVINKENIEETKVTDTVTEFIHEESTKNNENEVNMSETTEQNPSIPTSMKNGTASSESIKNDQIQNNILTDDKIDNEQSKINKEIDTNDKNKISENESVESTESERNEFNLKVTDEDETKENDNADNRENESVKQQQQNTEEIEDDITDKTEKDKIKEFEADEIKDNLDKIEEIEKDKRETTETTKEGQKEENSDKNVSGQKEQNSDKNVPEQKEQNDDKNVSDELKDVNAGSAELNDTINIDAAQSNNLSQEKQTIVEADDDYNDNQETNTSTINNVTLEDSTKNNVSTFNMKSLENNCSSTEGENERISESSIGNSEKETKYIDDVEEVQSNLENTNSSESAKNKVVAVKGTADQESTNTVTKVVEDIFDSVTDEFDNSQIILDQNKKYSEMEAETLEDISREIQKSADMPSLEPISSEIDNKELV